MLKKLLIISVFVFTCNISFGARYFAEVSSSNVVKRVIVADNAEWCSQTLGGTWIETFIDAPDKNYAGKGHDYFEIYKDFVAPTPYVSWVLNEKRKWVAPVARPKDGKNYRWDENTVSWKEVLLGAVQ